MRNWWEKGFSRRNFLSGLKWENKIKLEMQFKKALIFLLCCKSYQSSQVQIQYRKKNLWRGKSSIKKIQRTCASMDWQKCISCCMKRSRESIKFFIRVEWSGNFIIISMNCVLFSDFNIIIIGFLSNDVEIFILSAYNLLCPSIYGCHAWGEQIFKNSTVFEIF